MNVPTIWPTFVDPVACGKRCARDIDPGENALVQEKAMNCAPSIYEAADDPATIINPEGYGTRGARDIDGSKGAIVQEKAMAASRIVKVVEPTHDLVTIAVCADDLARDR